MLWECSQGCTDERPKSKGHPGRCRPHAEPFRYTKALKSTTGLKDKSDRRLAQEENGERPKGKARKGLKQTQRRETAAEKRARLHFNETVKSYPCWFRATRPCERCQGRGHVLYSHADPDHAGKGVAVECPVCGGDGRHHCRGPKDAHHVLPKRFIRMQFQALLPEKDFVAILFNPAIGAPLCRYGAHEPVEKKADRIYWEDLSEECVEYVGTLPDFCLIELERQCPKQDSVAAMGEAA